MEARSLAETGTPNWIRATELLAELELQGGQPQKAIELLCEIDERGAKRGVFLLFAECYLQIADGAKSDRETALANYKEAARCAKRAVKQAMIEAYVRDESKGLKMWARAALEFNPAVAYQAADRAIGLTSELAGELKELRHQALTEINAPPRRDLLGLDD
jgi:hypothetical protein